MEQQTMGKRIAQLRKEKGYTQEQLAELVGVSAQAVSKWENDVSCPDISILSQLSSVLGVTTDELLGAKPIEPKVVVVDSGNTKKGKDGKFSFSWDAGLGSKKDGIWFALLVIALGMAFLLQRLNVISIGVWGIVWPAVLIGLGVAWMIKRFSFFSLAVAGLGVYFLLFNLGATAFVLTWSVIWPSLLVLLGLTILYEALIPHRKHWTACMNGDHKPVSEFTEEGGRVHMECSFAEENRRFVSDSFAGGETEISFGKGELDLTNVKHFLSGATLNAEVSFGSMELIVPRFVRLSVKSDKSFGSIQTFGEPDLNAQEVLVVNADVSFGSMNIRYR